MSLLKAGVNNIVAQGVPFQESYKIEAAAGMYAGRLMKKGTSDKQILVGDALSPPVGFLGYEQTKLGKVPGSTGDNRPASVDTIYLINAWAALLNMAGMLINASVPAGFQVTKGDLMANWTNGQVVPVIKAPSGGLALKVPFKYLATSAVVGTLIEIPADMVISNAFIDVLALEGGDTLDVGFVNAVEGGDEDGLLDGVSCAALGKVFGLETLDGGLDWYVSSTLGAYLKDYHVGASEDDRGLFNRKSYVTDGTIKSLTYTPSNSTVMYGFIYVCLASEGFQVVGKAYHSKPTGVLAADIVTPTAVDTDILVRSVI